MVILPAWRRTLTVLMLVAALLATRAGRAGATGWALGLALVAIYERRTLRMPPLDFVRILLGLGTPILLIGHVVATRWAFEGLIGIVGIGSDVAADDCWQLPDDLRDSMSLDDKAAMGCNCMGTAIFTPGSCDFPGLGQYYVPEIDQPAIEKPADLAPKPAEPVIPPAPVAPADQTDQVEMAKYFSALQTYQDEVTLIQDDYRAQMLLYEAEAEVYQEQMVVYQEDLLTYEAARNSAVQRAEGVIESVTEEFGWAWVDKDDPAEFRAFLVKAWGAQGILIGVYILLILFLIKRKDAKVR